VRDNITKKRKFQGMTLAGRPPVGLGVTSGRWFSGQQRRTEGRQRRANRAHAPLQVLLHAFRKKRADRRRGDPFVVLIGSGKKPTASVAAPADPTGGAR
jgi:hypothetical protein